MSSSNALAITDLKNQIEALKIAIQQRTLVMPTPRVRTQLNPRPLTESSGDEYEKPMRELCLADTRLSRVYSRKDGSSSNTRVDDFYSAVVKWEEYDNASDEGEWAERLATNSATMNRHIHSLSRAAMTRRMVAASSTDNNSSFSNSSTLPRCRKAQLKGFGRQPKNGKQLAVDSAMLPEVIMANMASLHSKLEFITKTVMAQTKHITRPRWRKPHLKGFGRKPLNNRGVTVLPSRL